MHVCMLAERIWQACHIPCQSSTRITDFHGHDAKTLPQLWCSVHVGPQAHPYSWGQAPSCAAALRASVGLVDRSVDSALPCRRLPAPQLKLAQPLCTKHPPKACVPLLRVQAAARQPLCARRDTVRQHWPSPCLTLEDQGVGGQHYHRYPAHRDSCVHEAMDQVCTYVMQPALEHGHTNYALRLAAPTPCAM